MSAAWSVALVASLATPCAAIAQVHALTHVNVVDVATGTIGKNQTVVLEKGTIVAVGASARAVIPRGSRVLDLTGKYVIPGLWDMHAHVASTGRSSLALFLANGVTGVRDMGSLRDVVRPWRDSIEAGLLAGPRLVLAGPIIERTRWLTAVRGFAKQDGDSSLMRDLAARIPIDSPESAIQAVDSVIALGADFLKIRNDPAPPALFAMLRHARERGLLVAGHWPSNISPMEATDSGYRSLEHGALSPVGQGLAPTLDKLSAAERRGLFAQFVRNGTAFTPTIISLKGFRLTPDSVIARILVDSSGAFDSRRRYVDAHLLGVWRADFELKKHDTPPLDWASFSRSWNRDLREMADAGVLLLAGTDAGSPLVYPGFAVADELEALVTQGGLTPAQSLRAATLNVATWMHSEATTGSVAVGRRADLVVLDGNPITDITNVRRIRAVVRAGHVYDRRALDALLRGVAQASRLSATLDRWAEAVATNTDSPDEWSAVGRELFGAGRYREAVAAFERGLTLRASGSSDEAWYIARAYAQLGNRKQALRWLTHAQQLGFTDALAVGREPAFDKYRGDLRARALVRPTVCSACRSRLHAGKTFT